MFKRVGKKIMFLAVIASIFGILVSVVGGFTLVIIAAQRSSDFVDILLAALLGIGVMIVGSLISWISVFPAYGYGRLINNSDDLVQYAKNFTESQKSQARPQMQPRPQATAQPRPQAAAQPRPQAAAQPRPQAAAQPKPQAPAQPQPQVATQPEQPKAPAVEPTPAGNAAPAAEAAPATEKTDE